MGMTVTLDNELVKIARSHSIVQSRSVPRQIEHWAKIGRMVEDNPNLSYNAIKTMLMGLEDVNNGDVEKSPHRKRYALKELLRGTNSKTIKALNQETTWAREGKTEGREIG